VNISFRCLVLIIVLLAYCSTSYAEELSATGYLNYSTEEEFEDDEKIKETDVFNRNLYLALNKPVTRFLSYDLLFRTFWVDTTIDEANDSEEDRYIRVIEPEIGINLANPMYRLSGGYRRSETWTSDKLSDEHRLTTNFYYSRFSVFPRELPSLSLDFQRDEIFDHLSVSRTDITRVVLPYLSCCREKIQSVITDLS